jgi:hypothetical protein
VESEDGANQWKIGQPHSIAELHARVLVVLRQKSILNLLEQAHFSRT